MFSQLKNLSKFEWENGPIIEVNDVRDCGWCAQDHKALEYREDTDNGEILTRCPNTGGLIGHFKDESVYNA